MIPAVHDNREYYSRPEVVANYGNADYLTAAERLLFDRYLRDGMRILDLGVGGGRTSAVLARDATEYIGIDYAPAMTARCRLRFPHLRFETMDAADLSAFADDYFDLLVFSFNGLGYLNPDAQRLRALAECRRVLKPGCMLVFSLHNAGSLLFRPPVAAAWKTRLKVAWHSGWRLLRRIGQACFWRGEGYLVDRAVGNTLVFASTPARVQAMLAAAGFALLDVVGDDHPRRNIPCMTRWYYYSARKSPIS
ncbi:MAG TPA: class I SAM-dependent methyltransferase [Candidatus Acidoferrum sp.]|nr:class I SAM-dependent methyltransferase [Candidatus Acidoferrum sp.]